jgi:hypothetical protein
VPLLGGTSTSTATVVQSVRGISNEMELQQSRWNDGVRIYSINFKKHRRYNSRRVSHDGVVVTRSLSATRRL